MTTIYEKIWNVLKLAEKANTGVTFNAHEALELLGVLESYEESRALLRNDYEQTIADLKAEVKRLRNGLGEAVFGWSEFIKLLEEHPVLRGHSDKIRRIVTAIDTANEVLASIENKDGKTEPEKSRD